MLNSPWRSQCAAFSLVEVLVSLALASIGVLAALALGLGASRVTQSAEFRLQAALLADDMAERVRANPLGARSGLYQRTLTALATTAPAPPAAQCQTVCSAIEMAQLDLQTWQMRLYQALPMGSGGVDLNAQQRAGWIWVAWRDPAALDALDEHIQHSVERLCPVGLNPEPPAQCWRKAVQW